MPNWCSNYITIEGPEDALTLFKEKISSGEGLLSSTLPCPESLKNVKSGSSELAYHLHFGEIPAYMWKWEGVAEAGITPESTDRRSKLLAHLGKQGRKDLSLDSAEVYKHNVDTYGHMTWYGWQIETWGTKWDVPLGNAEVYKHKEHISLSFDTAWSPPLSWLETTSEKFPKLSFKIEYSELGNWFAGFATYIDGAAKVFQEGEPDSVTSKGDLVFDFCQDDLDYIQELEEEES